VAAELKPVYLLVGGDGPKISRALARLRARVGDDAVESASARDTGGEAAVALCNAMGLFAGGSRLVLVDEVERWKAPDVKAVAAYLADPNPDTVLALTGDVKADSPLGKAVGKHGEVLVYDVSKRALPGWVKKQFEQAGASADEDACRALIDLVGEDLDALATEVDKLATWAAGEPVGSREVERLVPAVAEVPAWDLTDAWGKRDVRAVLAALETILDRSDRARRDEIARITGSLVGHVGRIRACQALAAEGVRPREAAGSLRMHPFAAEKAFAQAANFEPDELADALVRLADLDHALKGGSRLAADLELERTLVEITRPRAAELVES
jgi:DNA polymerase-3 subunit delta